MKSTGKEKEGKVQVCLPYPEFREVKGYRQGCGSAGNAYFDLSALEVGHL